MSAGSVEASQSREPGLITSTNPASGEVLGTVACATGAEVAQAVGRARVAQARWATLSPRERGRRLQPFRELLVARVDELAAAITRENGKTLTEAVVMEITALADLIAWFGKHAERILRPQAIRLHLLVHRRSYLHFAPRGVVGIVSPWNFPLVIPFGEAVMALLAGNAAVIKPSEVTPLIANTGRSLLVESGLDPDLVQVVHGGGAVGAALIDSGVDMVCFTGSVATGRKVGAACGERLIPCVLELGGKAPAVVCEDADLDRTARALVWGAFANSGQICASVERVYAVGSVHDRLVDRVVALTRDLRQGDPSDLDTDVGAICFGRQLDVAAELVADARAQGAQVLVGGDAVEGDGQFFPPTVLSGATQQMRIMREESFAPLLPIMAVSSEDEAVRLANDSNVGLLAYVFTTDRERGRALAERIEAGTVMVNDVLSTYGAPETPWMGVKDSGIGRVHSEEGLRSLCQARHVNHDQLVTPPKELWWYPYGPGAYKRATAALKLLFGRWLGAR